ncbi:MAG: hypothetical protein CMN30_28840 [Sandaracinus sp.]|nr:hypothetical protein [Sandaracinus sp.]
MTAGAEQAALRLVMSLVWSAVGCDDPPPRTDPSAAITPFELPDAPLERAGGDGAPVRVDRPALLHFWATWCAPCRQELPSLLKLADEIDGVRVIAVSDEPWSAIEAHFAPGPVPRWIARDPAGELRRALGARTLPDTYVVDDDGVARRRVAGSLDWARPSIRAWVLSLRTGEESR